MYFFIMDNQSTLIALNAIVAAAASSQKDDYR